MAMQDHFSNFHRMTIVISEDSDSCKRSALIIFME